MNVREEDVISRILSIVISVSYVVGAYCWQGGEPAAAMTVFCLIALACIWFPRVLSDTGDDFPIAMGDRPSITAESPPGAIAFFGWLMLVLPMWVGPLLWSILHTPTHK